MAIQTDDRAGSDLEYITSIEDVLERSDESKGQKREVNLDGFEEPDLSEKVIYAAEGGHFVIRRPALLANNDPLPNIEYSWYNGETQVYSNRSHYITSRGDLVVLDAIRSSFGGYKVVASVEGLGEAVSSIFTVQQQMNTGESREGLFIIYHSEDRTVYSSGSSQKRPESFDCVASLKDGTRTRWFLNGVVISGTETGTELSQNNRRLTMMVPDALGKGRSEHKLECKVDAASGVLFDQRSSKIKVIEEPTLKPSPSEKFLPLGSRLTIPCSPRKNSVPSKIQWYFNGNEVWISYFAFLFFRFSHPFCFSFLCGLFSSLTRKGRMYVLWICG
ncbi:hypothetical protein COOONC_06574 [Cooperia oncophora]